MAKNIVAVKSKGFSIASEYISRACKDAGYLGVALAQGGELLVHHEPKRPTVEAVNSILEKFKDDTVIFCFGENTKTSLEEDRLPFQVILDKTKGHELAVFLTGDFNGYSVKDSSHTDEYHCFEDALKNKLTKVYRGAGSDFPEFLKELNDPITQQDLSNFWTNRGFISLLTNTGEPITLFNKGNVFVRKYSWGTVSDGMGYEEAAPVKTEQAKPLSMLDRMMLKKSGTPAPADLPAEAKADTAVGKIDAAISTDKFEDVQLPREAFDKDKRWTNAQKETWWINEVGYKPDGYKDGKTKVRRTKGTKIGVLAPLAATNVVADAATAGTAERKITDSTAMDHRQEMKVDPKTLPDKIQPGTKDTSPHYISAENMPIIGPKIKLLLKKEFLADAEIIKVLGDDFQAMAMAPKNLKDLEDTYQPFWDGLGHDNDPYMTFEGLLKLGALDLKALAVLAFNNQNDKVKAQVKLESITKANPTLKVAM